LFLLQNFDSWNIVFGVLKPRPQGDSREFSRDGISLSDRDKKYIREYQLTLPAESREDFLKRTSPVESDPAVFRATFEAGVIADRDDKGCQVYVDAAKASQSYGRDLVKVPRLDNAKATTSYEPMRFAWIIENGEVPETHLLKRCDWNPFCVNLGHLSLERRPIPELELL
jgi:hypothetical protein